jgi:hypothetical protein
MYYIQGADKKEYGPISAEQIRQWIGENRLNRASPCRAAEDTVWKSLGEFPEFGDAFLAQPPSAGGQAGPSLSGDPTLAVSQEELMSKVRPPAIAVIVAAALGGLMALINVVMAALGIGQGQQLPPGLPEQYQRLMQGMMDFSQKYGIFTNLLVLVLSIVTIVAGIRMMSLRTYGFVLFGVVIGMVPCLGGCCCLGLPFGIWAIVVLNRPEVKAAFR